MNRILRIVSTAVVGIGLLLIFLYLCFFENAGKGIALTQPSYYAMQNYWYLFLAGIGCTAFSVISCFFSWHKTMDTKEEILPNAISAQKEDVTAWVSGSSLDTGKTGGKTQKAAVVQNTSVPTSDRTVVDVTKKDLEQNGHSDQTVIQDGDAQTLLDQEETILENSEETVLEIIEDQTVLENDSASDVVCSSNEAGREKQKKRNKALPLILAGVVVVILLAGSLAFGNKKDNSEVIEKNSASEAEAQNETTVATTEEMAEDEYHVVIETSDGMLTVMADFLEIRVVNERDVTVTLSGIELEESYITNLSTTEENYTEYSWGFDMYGWGTYSVSTTAWASNPGAEEEKTLEEMQHAVFTLVEEDGEEYYTYVCDAEMTHTESSITWSFSIPNDFVFDFEEMQHFTTSVYDAPNDYFLTRTYVVDSSK